MLETKNLHLYGWALGRAVSRYTRKIPGIPGEIHGDKDTRMCKIHLGGSISRYAQGKLG
jgi:hypothetical protein